MEFSSIKAETNTMIKKHSLPKIDMAGVGARLDALRKAINLPKGEFSTSFGVDPSSYAKIISGSKPLKSEHAFAISERWGVTMDYIYRGRLGELPPEYRDTILKTLNSKNL